jgi:hypothetical protein
MSPVFASATIKPPTATEGPLTLTALALGSQWQESADCITTGTLSTFEVRCSFADLVHVHNWWGFCPNAQYEALFTLSSPYVPTFAFLGFRFATDQDGTAPGGMIHAYASKDSTHFTSVNTGAVADTLIHIYGITMSNGGTTATFFIDGVQVATIFTNIPAVATTLSPVLSSVDFTEGAADQQIGGSYMGWLLNH